MQHAIQLAAKNKVVFLIADSKMSKYYNEMVVENSCFGKDDKVELIENWKDLNNLKQILDKYDMFDIAVMNPPYEKGLHLKILNNIKNNVECIVNISPINKYQEYFIFNTFKSQALIDLTSTHTIEFAKYIDCDTACSLFGLGSLGCDVGVYKITKGKIDNIEKNLNIVVPDYTIVKKLLTNFQISKNLMNI